MRSLRRPRRRRSDACEPWIRPVGWIGCATSQFPIRNPRSAISTIRVASRGSRGTSARPMSDRSLLSTKSIDPRDRLIFALDVSTTTDAMAWVDRLGDAVTFYKIGLELFCSGGYFELLSHLQA